jgi:LCP family protein required for cell wall assembly
MSQASSDRKPLPRRLRRPAIVLAGVLSMLIALGSTYAFGYLLYLQANLNRADTGPLTDAFDGPQNILILGSDSRANLTPEEQEAQGSQDDVPGQRADTIILLHFDPSTGKSVVVHFPRDLRVVIHGTGELNKINTAFEGGPRRMIETVEAYSGLNINHYVEVDFDGFKDIVDAMGGVDICIDRPLIDRVAELYLPEVGCYLLGGKMALAFVRARGVEGDLIPDFSRIARQQQFLRAVLNRTSIFSLPGVARAVIDSITVDEGITVTDMYDISKRLGKIGTPDVDFRVVPGIPQTIGEISYVVPYSDLAEELFARLREGRPLGKVGLELPLTQAHAGVKIRVVDAGGDVELVRARLINGGFDVLPTIDAPAGEAGSGILYARSREPAAALVARYLGSLFAFESPPSVEPAAKGFLQEAHVGIVVGPDFPEPVRRSGS